MTALAAVLAGIAAITAWFLLRPLITPNRATTGAHPPTQRAQVAVVEAAPQAATAMVTAAGQPPPGWQQTSLPTVWATDPHRHPDAIAAITELMDQPVSVGVTRSGAALIVDQAVTGPLPADSAHRHQPGPPSEGAPRQEPTTRPTHAIRPDAQPAAEHHVVRVLGNVGLNDRTANPRPRTLELIAYLTFHPGATTDDIKTALWPDQAITPSAFNNCVAAARRALGRTPSGDDHLPVAANGTYRVGPGVTTDAHDLAIAVTADDHAAIRDILSNLRGLPFTSPSGYHWAHEEGLDSAATETVVRAADTLAREALRDGDINQADWAARTALLAAPGERRLWRIRLLCAPGPNGLEKVARQIINDIGGLDHELADAYRARGGRQALA